MCFPLHVEVDAIYNLACPASPVHYQSDPVQTTKTSVIGALNMLGLAKRLKAPVLQASTSECYGDPAVHPQPETYWGHVNPIGPRSCYDEGKRCAETLFFDYHRQHGVDIKVARIFNTYGPRMHPGDGRVVSNFIVQALKGEDITLYGDGSQTRSFCYVDDLVEGLMRLMATPRGVTGPINLGNPGEFTILQLAEAVVEMTGSRSRLVHRPLPQDDPRQRRPDLARAKAELDWQPTTALRTGSPARSPISARCSTCRTATCPTRRRARPRHPPVAGRRVAGALPRQVRRDGPPPRCRSSSWASAAPASPPSRRSSRAASACPTSTATTSTRSATSTRCTPASRSTTTTAGPGSTAWPPPWSSTRRPRAAWCWPARR